MRKEALQVHLDPPLMKKLRSAAKRRKVSMSEVVRIALQKLVESSQAATKP